MMIKRRAILVLNDLEYEILRCGYRFTRKIDAKGRPISGIRGGDLWVVLESGEDNRILSQMLLKSIPASKGYIALLGGEDYQCIRRIEFEKAYIYSHGEQMQADVARPMMTQVHITSLRLDVNDNVRLDRRWPETSGFHWQKYEEPEVKYARNETEEQEAEMLPQITRIYWKDADGKEIQNLPDQGVATLCAMTENTSAGDTLQFDVELSEGDVITVSGTVDDSGLIEIQNVNLGSEK